MLDTVNLTVRKTLALYEFSFCMMMLYLFLCFYFLLSIVLATTSLREKKIEMVKKSLYLDRFSSDSDFLIPRNNGIVHVTHLIESAMNVMPSAAVLFNVSDYSTNYTLVMNQTGSSVKDFYFNLSVLVSGNPAIFVFTNYSDAAVYLVSPNGQILSTAETSTDVGSQTILTYSPFDSFYVPGFSNFTIHINTGACLPADFFSVTVAIGQVLMPGNATTGYLNGSGSNFWAMQVSNNDNLPLTLQLSSNSGALIYVSIWLNRILEYIGQSNPVINAKWSLSSQKYHAFPVTLLVIVSADSVVNTSYVIEVDTTSASYSLVLFYVVIYICVICVIISFAIMIRV